MSWKTEFGESYNVPDTFDCMVATGKLKDLSWHNDVCPSFGLEDANDLRIFVEHENPAMREVGPESKRYAVSTRDKDILTTDSILEAIEAFEKGSA